MNYIPPVQLCLEKREYQRCMFSWSKLQKLQLRAVPLQRQIGRQGGSRGDLSHPWPAGPPSRASGSPLPSRRSQCRPGRARLAGLGAERGCSGTAPCIACSCSDNALINGTVRRESTHFIKARAGWWLSEAQTWAVCRETAGEAQVKVNYGCEFPLQPIKPTEPRKYLKAGTSGLPTESF